MRAIIAAYLFVLSCLLSSTAIADSSYSVSLHNNFIYDAHGDPQGTGNLKRSDLRHVESFYAFIYRDGTLVKYVQFMGRQVLSETTVKHDGLTTTLSTKSADDLPIQLIVQHRRNLEDQSEYCPATAIESQETTTYLYGDSDEPTSSTITDHMETDECGRILARETTLPDGESTGRLEFGYEEVGGVVVMTSIRPVSSNSSASFGFYDLEGRFVRSLDYDVDGTLMTEMRQYYDEYGRVSRVVALDADAEMIYETTYAYDDHGTLVDTVTEDGTSSEE